MKLKKQQMMIFGVIIIALIMVASVAVVMMLNNEEGDANNNGIDDETNNDSDSTDNGDNTNDNGDDSSVVTGNWVNLSSNIDIEEYAPDFSDVFFTAADTGWITESGQANIYKTVDGAASFSIQTTPQGGTSAIHMLDADNGYSGGQGGGWIYKTSDGGLNWNVLASMGTFLDMSFPFDTDPNNPTGYASGNSGNVWKITSTLTNLNSPSSSTFSGISAPSVNNVWACGGNRIYYYDGIDFTSQIAPAGAFNDIYFINNLEGWVVGDSGVIGHTENGGNNWITQTNPDTQDRSLYSVFFLDSNNGWAVGSDGLILHTTDGGTNWSIEGEGLTTEFLRGVHFTSPTNGYVVGNGKTIFKFVGE